jgi:7-cyano-7-deazaguanine synthase in queuosine biosynthesis
MEIEINDVNIPLIDGNVGLLLSGGADSSLLLYILLSNKKETLEVFTLASDLKGRISAKTTANVIDKCIQLTSNNNINHHVVYTDVQTDEKLWKLPYEMIADKKINTLYSAVTANPPKEIADRLLTPAHNTEQSSRDPTITKSIIMFDNFCCPFINIDKLKIAEMYSTLGLIDTLFPLTRSCELENPPSIFLGHCNNCWWCKERLWAFKKYD